MVPVGSSPTSGEGTDRAFAHQSANARREAEFLASAPDRGAETDDRAGSCEEHEGDGLAEEGFVERVGFWGLVDRRGGSQSTSNALKSSKHQTSGGCVWWLKFGPFWSLDIGAF